MNTGYRIKKLREHRNYTQNYMADRLNISQNAYSKIENGVSRLTTDRLEEIAKILEVPVETLWESEKQVFNQHNNNDGTIYGTIENLHTENKELLQKTIDLYKEELEILKKQNEALLKTLAELAHQTGH